MILEFLFLLFQKNGSVGRWETKHFMGMVLVETSWFDNIFIFLCLNDHDWCSYKPCSVRPLKSLYDDSDLQTSEYRIYYSNVQLTTINTGVAFTSNRWDFVWEIKYWALRTLNIIILTYFSIKWIKETYLWCVPVFFGVNSSIYSFFLAVIVWPLSLSS